MTLNTTMDERVQKFASWFLAHEQSFRLKPAEEVADEVSAALLQVDEQLGVEVANESDGDREMIITAFSDPSRFATVQKVVDHLAGLQGWSFVPLKPARGFAFKIEVGSHALDASTLRFSPANDVPEGIKLIPASKSLASFLKAEQPKELAWLIVETGIGEALAGRVEDIEFVTDDMVKESHPISELESFVTKRKVS